MGSILQTTLNTRVLPTGNFRYVRSDYPGKLTDDEVRWLYQNDITTIVDLREEKEYNSFAVVGTTIADNFGVAVPEGTNENSLFKRIG